MDDQTKKNKELKEIATTNSTSSVGFPNRIRPEDILKQIGEMTNPISTLNKPSLLRQICSPDEREMLRVRNEVIKSEIKARKVMIDGLTACITTYIKTHEGDLKIRGITWLQTRFTELFTNLDKVSSDIIISFFETYSNFCSRTENIPNLPADEKDKMKKEALKRAWTTSSKIEKTFTTLLSEIESMVRSVIKEVSS